MELLPFDEYVQSLNRKRMSAGVVFRTADRRVLLVEPSYKPHWDLPGGAVDAEEPPWTTAAREVREEIGVTRPLGPLLIIDYAPTDDRFPEGIAFLFDGGVITDEEVGALVLTDPEIISAALHTLDEATAKVKPILARRLRTALDAAESGRLALCENGVHVTG